MLAARAFVRKHYKRSSIDCSSHAMVAKQPLSHIHQLVNLGPWFEEKSKNLGPPGQQSATKGVQKILDFRLSLPS